MTTEPMEPIPTSHALIDALKTSPGQLLLAYAMTLAFAAVMTWIVLDTHRIADCIAGQSVLGPLDLAK